MLYFLNVIKLQIASFNGGFLSSKERDSRVKDEEANKGGSSSKARVVGAVAARIVAVWNMTFSAPGLNSTSIELARVSSTISNLDVYL